jgi:signal transduction histidine kinase
LPRAGDRLHDPGGIGGEDERPGLPVEDEGPGLPVEHIAWILEPFFTRRIGGTGLGRSIVQRVVEAHGGEATAGNRASRGACFTVRLPLGPAAEVNQRA